MNELIPRTKLSELIGLSDSTLRKAISRGQMIPSERKGYINVCLDENRTYLTNNCAKRGIDIDQLLYKDLPKPKPKAEIKKSNKEQEISPESDQEIDSITGVPVKSQSELNKIKIKKEIEKLQVTNKLAELEYSKKKAKVLPIDFIIEWSGRNIRGIFGQGVNFGNSFIEDLCNELDAPIEVKLKYKKRFKDGFNEMVNKGVKSQLPEAIEYAKEYSLINKW